MSPAGTGIPQAKSLECFVPAFLSSLGRKMEVMRIRTEERRSVNGSRKESK